MKTTKKYFLLLLLPVFLIVIALLSGLFEKQEVYNFEDYNKEQQTKEYKEDIYFRLVKTYKYDDEYYIYSWNSLWEMRLPPTNNLPKYTVNDTKDVKPLQEIFADEAKTIYSFKEDNFDYIVLNFPHNINRKILKEDFELLKYEPQESDYNNFYLDFKKAEAEEYLENYIVDYNDYISKEEAKKEEIAKLKEEAKKSNSDKYVNPIKTLEKELSDIVETKAMIHHNIYDIENFTEKFIARKKRQFAGEQPYYTKEETNKKIYFANLKPIDSLIIYKNDEEIPLYISSKSATYIYTLDQNMTPHNYNKKGIESGNPKLLFLSDTVKKIKLATLDSSDLENKPSELKEVDLTKINFVENKIYFLNLNNVFRPYLDLELSREPLISNNNFSIAISSDKKILEDEKYSKENLIQESFVIDYDKPKSIDSVLEYELYNKHTTSLEDDYLEYKEYYAENMIPLLQNGNIRISNLNFNQKLYIKIKVEDEELAKKIKPEKDIYEINLDSDKLENHLEIKFVDVKQKSKTESPQKIESKSEASKGE